MNIKMTLGILFALSTPALAAPGNYLKADGMSGHVGRAVKQPGEHVVKFKMLTGVHAVDRHFVLLASGPNGQRYVHGSVHMPNGKVTTTRVEKTR